MTESATLWVQCSECNNIWKPFGETKQILPLLGMTVTCPSCGHKGQYEWRDSETERKILAKEHGLSVDPSVKKLEEVIGRLELVEAKLETLTKLSDLTNSEVKQVKAWAGLREQDFKEIEEMAQEHKEDKKFRDSIGQ